MSLEDLPIPAKQAKNGVYSGITKSLFSRQLFSAVIITILGLLLLSGVYYHTKQQSFIEKARTNAVLMEGNIVGLITYNDETGRYYTEPDLIESIRTTLDGNQLTNDGDQNFAYIISTDNQQLIWHSQAFDSVNHNNPSTPPYPKEYLNALPILDIKKDLEKGTNSIEILAAKNAIQGRQNSGGSNYITYHSAFSEGPRNFQLVIAKSAKEMENAKSDLIEQAIVLILITTMLVIFAQLVNSYLVIKPIKRFEQEIKDIESGSQEFVKGIFPTELLEVKHAINALVHVEKGQKKRYRESLDNLAHSLKTPLAVLQGFAESNTTLTEQQNTTLVNQVTRMNDIIAYQLRRATISDHNANIQRQSIRPILYRLKTPMLKVHHSKSFNIDINVDENSQCRMDKDDLLEVFGNLINNACRFCEKIVSVTASNNGETITVDIDDDGLGFPDKNPSTLLKRGMRADNKTEGQGIGLAVSNEIIEAAGGRMELLVSPHIGARVRLHLPV
ncbi:MAG: two-component sensor histidine kinase [Cocleimonas sp.]|nr:two-component sensor histidine kinase [Cocleimonas sp.]